MNKQQSGFTLIELVMVIVILGILAATALPKFVDLRADANKAVADGTGGALSAAATINFSGCAAKNFALTPNVCVKVAKCSDLGNLLNPASPFTIGTVPPTTNAKTLYITSANDQAVATAGASVTCSATYGDGSGGQGFTFTAIGT